MHGLGNDFMVIDNIDQPVKLTKEQIQKWADRHTGVGFDQLLLIEKNSASSPQFSYKIYNADGSTAEQCGNGARCIARYILDKGWEKQQQFSLQAPTGKIWVTAQPDGQISIEMGEPRFNPKDIPFITANSAQDYQYSLEVLNQTINVTVLSMGNPHAVLFIPNIETAPINTIGKAISEHSAFPQSVNVEFVQVISENTINVRVLERGAGETLACGSGACAAAVAAYLCQKTREDVTVTLPGGRLNIKWKGIGHPVIMTGPAVTVFHGEIPFIQS